jgi:hypothetical protein
LSDVNIFARGLLDFAEQSIAEGLRDQTSLLECLNEADCALRILHKRLGEQDPRIAQLALLGIFDSNVELAKNNPGDYAERLQKVIEAAQVAKTLFP